MKKKKKPVVAERVNDVSLKKSKVLTAEDRERKRIKSEMSKKHKNEIMKLIKKNEITMGKLSIVSNITRSNLTNIYRAETISEENYKILTKGIEKILNKKLSFDDLYIVREKKKR